MHNGIITICWFVKKNKITLCSERCDPFWNCTVVCRLAGVEALFVIGLFSGGVIMPCGHSKNVRPVAVSRLTVINGVFLVAYLSVIFLNN